MDELETILTENRTAKLFELLKQWNSLASSQQPVVITGNCHERLGLLLHLTCGKSSWQEAFVVSSSLGIAVSTDSEFRKNVATSPNGLWCQRVKASFTLCLAACGEDWDGVNDIVARRGTLMALCGLLQVCLAVENSSILADSILQSQFVVAAMLCLAAQHLNRDILMSFAELQLRRSLADLLGTLLEESSPHVRICLEKQLLSELSEPGASQLVDAIVNGHPDPKLHELLLELLWRGMRRLEDGSSTPAVDFFKRLSGPKPCAQLKTVTSEQLLEWGLDLVLQLNQLDHEVIPLTSCSIQLGDVQSKQGVVTFTRYGITVEMVGDEEQHPVAFDVPWECVEEPCAGVKECFPIFFEINTLALQSMIQLPPSLQYTSTQSRPVLKLNECESEPETLRALHSLLSLFGGPSSKSVEELELEFQSAGLSQMLDAAMEDNEAGLAASQISVDKEDTENRVVETTEGTDVGEPKHALECKTVICTNSFSRDLDVQCDQDGDDRSAELLQNDDVRQESHSIAGTDPFEVRTVTPCPTTNETASCNQPTSNNAPAMPENADEQSCDNAVVRVDSPMGRHVDVQLCEGSEASPVGTHPGSEASPAAAHPGSEASPVGALEFQQTEHEQISSDLKTMIQLNELPLTGVRVSSDTNHTFCGGLPNKEQFNLPTSLPDVPSCDDLTHERISQDQQTKEGELVQCLFSNNVADSHRSVEADAQIDSKDGNSTSGYVVVEENQLDFSEQPSKRAKQEILESSQRWAGLRSREAKQCASADCNAGKSELPVEGQDSRNNHSNDDESCPLWQLDLELLSWKQLKDLCRKNNLPSAGRKKELLSRLQDVSKAVQGRVGCAPDADDAIDITVSASEAKPCNLSRDLDALPVTELRAACAELDLPSEGRKADLMARLVMFADSMMTPIDSNVEEESADRIALVENTNCSPTSSQKATSHRSSSQFGPKETAALVQDLSSLCLKELRQACEEHGLPQTGSKFDLVERLTEVATQGVGTQLCVPNSHSPLLGGLSDAVICQGETHCEAELDFVRNNVSEVSPQLGEEDGPQQNGVISCGELQIGMEGVSLDALQIACRACGLPDVGDAAALASALAQHLSQPDSQEIVQVCPTPSQSQDETSFVETTTTVASLVTTMPMQLPGEPKASVGIASACDSIPACSPPAQLRGEVDIAGIAVVPAMMTMPVQTCTQRQPLVSIASGCDSIPAAQPDDQSPLQVESGEERHQNHLDSENCRPSFCGMHEAQTPHVMKADNDPAVAGLNFLSRRELRRVCSLRGVDTSGSRQQLIARVVAQGSVHDEHSASPSSSGASSPDKQGAYVGISEQAEAQVHAVQRDAFSECSVGCDLIRKQNASEASPANKAECASAATKRPLVPWLLPETQLVQKYAAQSNLLHDGSDDLTPLKQRSLLKRPRWSDHVVESAEANMSTLFQIMSTGAGHSSSNKLDKLVASEQVSRQSYTTLPPSRATSVPQQWLSEQPGSVALVQPTHKKQVAARGLSHRTARSRSKRRSSVGTCHGHTLAGAPCRSSGCVRPVGARFQYCRAHATKWARFEPVGFDHLPAVLDRNLSSSHEESRHKHRTNKVAAESCAILTSPLAHLQSDSNASKRNSNISVVSGTSCQASQKPLQRPSLVVQTTNVVRSVRGSCSMSSGFEELLQLLPE